jgi:hypothetical protein
MEILIRSVRIRLFRGTENARNSVPSHSVADKKSSEFRSKPFRHFVEEKNLSGIVISFWTIPRELEILLRTMKSKPFQDKEKHSDDFKKNFFCGIGRHTEFHERRNFVYGITKNRFEPILRNFFRIVISMATLVKTQRGIWVGIEECGGRWEGPWIFFYILF